MSDDYAIFVNDLTTNLVGLDFGYENLPEGTPEEDQDKSSRVFSIFRS